MENILYQYNPWWETELILKGVKHRDIYLNKLKKYMDSNVIILLREQIGA